jgi:RNAse (barnase) inhibitor barstar
VIVSVARIQARNIRDWDSFHDEFQRVFGFPSFYGRNMDAWVDCMTSLDREEEAMTAIHVVRGSVLTLEIEDAAHLKASCRDQYDAIVECAAFVNWRRIERGGSAVIALSFYV